MSVDRELQFLAMLEGHELEKELLDIVSIIIISFSWFSKENLFSQPNLAFGKSATNLQPQ